MDWGSSCGLLPGLIGHMGQRGRFVVLAAEPTRFSAIGYKVRGPPRKGPLKPITTVRVGGVALIFGAVAFMAVFSFLAARFDYPTILDGPASTGLPRLLATGTSGR